MIQRGQRLRFAREASQPVRVAGERRGQHLDGDLAIELRVACAIDLAHSAGTDLCGDFVGAETRAGSKGQAAVNYMSGTTTPTGLLLINAAESAIRRHGFLVDRCPENTYLRDTGGAGAPG